MKLQKLKLKEDLYWNDRLGYWMTESDDDYKLYDEDELYLEKSKGTEFFFKNYLSDVDEEYEDETYHEVYLREDSIIRIEIEYKDLKKWFEFID